MSFLLDTNICSAHLKRSAELMHRFVQHSGQLYISTLVLAELYTWAHQRSDPHSLADRIERELVADVGVLDFDSDCARKFGEVRGTLLCEASRLSKSQDRPNSTLCTHPVIGRLDIQRRP